ncbi:mandelate racemase/muconate lactonizing enzyme family protein [Maritimibacter sp. UBA3975]|uniref:mandelate racemase/muconate lactonizing enzyme family protein n=1 Tax=Maritimibacter sp. UBA3975 TaxID=1946833 RepID=UPI000C0B1F61|nr:mandelate racemase/muconate lactonizing enzyme family protein [Maritimibacter sp. UBA3975]MAM62236.1 mandelate racemase [Maritimibacter sp.]|tara:strand:- start:15582 stop:16787 length:1206 start_codon:yes stop_codon:yes gene_type:complete
MPEPEIGRVAHGSKDASQRADLDFTLVRIEGFAFRVPVEIPVETSFGKMRDRPAVFLRVEDGNGNFGWGEVFANWPASGAEHRVNLLMDDVADLVLRKRWSTPAEMFHELEEATLIRALQCGEPGPFAQVIAGLDIAVWDLVSRRAGLPLAKLLSSAPATRVETYASGIKIDAADVLVPRARAAGFTRYKVKVGFHERDVDKLEDAFRRLNPGELLCADANQVWSLPMAADFLNRIRKAGVALGWMEEPLPVFAPAQEWATLAELGTPLAGGENIAGFAAFDRAIRESGFSVVQPDVSKWGGVTGCLDVAKRTRAAGKTYCPHFLGGGIGLAASAHVLAAAGGDGVLEVDVNPNPLRSAFQFGEPPHGAGHWVIGTEPGLGCTELPASLLPYLSHRRERAA